MKIDFERHLGASGDGIDTHKWNTYQREYHIALRMANHQFDDLIIDPFARKCKWGHIRNDLDENMPTQYHLDGADFMELIATDLQYQYAASLILFDPPFSSSQAKKYEIGDQNLYAQSDGRIPRIGNASLQLLRPGGIFLKLGYNSNKPAKGLELVRVALASFGGTRNDVIFSHWMKVNFTLNDFSSGNEGGGG
jgi:hypothetical protein